jgi:hypothetical protein
MLRRLFLLSVALLLALPALAADVTGTWKAEVQTDAGSGNPTFVLKQDGEKLTGTYSGQLGEAKLTGTIKGTEITFQFDVGAAVIYVGTVDVAGAKMSGQVDLAGQAKGTFTAEKQK